MILCKLQYLIAIVSTQPGRTKKAQQNQSYFPPRALAQTNVSVDDFKYL